jgi:hypothetical protein
MDDKRISEICVIVRNYIRKNTYLPARVLLVNPYGVKEDEIDELIRTDYLLAQPLYDGGPKIQINLASRGWVRVESLKEQR